MCRFRFTHSPPPVLPPAPQLHANHTQWLGNWLLKIVRKKRRILFVFLALSLRAIQMFDYQERGEAHRNELTTLAPPALA